MANSRRLQTPSLSKALRKWFLMTCSLVSDDPADFAICHTFPDQKRNLDFLRSEALAGSHD
jgi:hypothetical protein